MGSERRSSPKDFLTPEEWRAIADGWSWSRREEDVAKLLLTGVARKDAARSLGISLSTLRTHFRRALWKARAEDLITLLWKVVGARDRCHP